MKQSATTERFILKENLSDDIKCAPKLAGFKLSCPLCLKAAKQINLPCIVLQKTFEIVLVE